MVACHVYYLSSEFRFNPSHWSRGVQCCNFDFKFNLTERFNLSQVKQKISAISAALKLHLSLKALCKDKEEFTATYILFSHYIMQGPNIYFA